MSTLAVGYGFEEAGVPRNELVRAIDLAGLSWRARISQVELLGVAGSGGSRYWQHKAGSVADFRETSATAHQGRNASRLRKGLR